jgi:hypothetical protein
MNQAKHDMTIAGTAARLRASIAWLRDGTPTQSGGIGVADMVAMLPIIEHAIGAARICAVCGRPPHAIDDSECMPATKPIAEQLAWALGEMQRLRTAPRLDEKAFEDLETEGHEVQQAMEDRHVRELDRMQEDCNADTVDAGRYRFWRAHWRTQFALDGRRPAR